MNYISILLFIILFVGLYLTVMGLIPVVDREVEKSIRRRGRRKRTSVQEIKDFLTPKIIKYISIDNNTKRSVQQDMDVLMIEGTPEILYSNAITMGIIGFFNTIFIGTFAILFLYVLGFNISISVLFLVLVVLAMVSAVSSYKKVFSDIKKQLETKRIAIDWELPQFTGTVYQQLNQNRNSTVLDILLSYSKISGEYLGGEIDRTINEINSAVGVEQALENMARRVNSSGVNQVTQGLVSLNRGDNQYQYFQMLTSNFEVKHAELIKQELLKRPKQLTPYNIMLLVGIVSMLVIAVGSHLMDSVATFM